MLEGLLRNGAPLRKNTGAGWGGSSFALPVWYGESSKTRIPGHADMFDTRLLAESQHLPLFLPLAIAFAAAKLRKHRARRMPETFRRARPVGEPTQLVRDDVNLVDLRLKMPDNVGSSIIIKVTEVYSQNTSGV